MYLPGPSSLSNFKLFSAEIASVNIQEKIIMYNVLTSCIILTVLLTCICVLHDMLLKSTMFNKSPH